MQKCLYVMKALDHLKVSKLKVLKTHPKHLKYICSKGLWETEVS